MFHLALEMRPFEVDTTDILPSLTVHPIDPRGRPALGCAAACNAIKASLDDVTSCNTFVMKDGLCHIGYLEPLWIVENSATPVVGGDKIYSDITP